MAFSVPETAPRGRRLSLPPALTYRLRRGRSPFAVPLPAYAYFGGTGVVIALAIATMFAAIGAGSILVVSPIVATFPVFTLLTALVLGDERLRPAVVLGVALVVTGVVLLGLATPRVEGG
jgi:drug/metabolite transporter (DMT)-like permease